MITYILIFFCLILLLYLAYLKLSFKSLTDKEFNRILDAHYEYIYSHITTYEKQIYNSKIIEWKFENEFEIRSQAIEANSNRITSEIHDESVLLKENLGYNPRDIKFVGKYIDLIIFDGAAEEKDVSIIFIEVCRPFDKSNLTYKQKVKRAVFNQNYSWKEFNL